MQIFSHYVNSTVGLLSNSNFHIIFPPPSPPRSSFPSSPFFLPPPYYPLGCDIENEIKRRACEKVIKILDGCERNFIRLLWSLRRVYRRNIEDPLPFKKADVSRLPTRIFIWRKIGHSVGCM